MSTIESTSTAAETTMADEATAMTAAKAASVSTADTTGVTSAVLRPHGHNQGQRQRRDGRQAPHTGRLYACLGTTIWFQN